jgi:DNA-binding CsgD family transcriptional regulator
MLVARCGLSPVMVGRSAELERLSRLLAAGETPDVALIGGEPGIGKTRLVQELVARVGDRALVLVGQADSGALGRPFDLLLDAVEGDAEAHADLLEEITDASRPLDDRVRAGVDLVRRLTEPGPALVVFEDLHWADSESIALFERLAEPDGGRLLLVGTYRPEALTRRHPAADLLPRLERRHGVTHIRLDRLSTTDLSAFLATVYGHLPSYRVVETLHARTGGNPFFLEELLTAAGDTDIDELCALPLPWSLAEVVRSQLDDLSSEARRIVEAASVLGRRVPFELLATVTRTTEDELIVVLRELVAEGLMIETESDVFGFRHTLAREAIEGGLLGRERRRLHELALEALREAGSNDMAAIAQHAQGAGRDADMVSAARVGARHYLALGSSFQALQLAELGLTEADDDLELLSLAARSAWLAGLIDDALGHSMQWLDVARRAGNLEAEASAQRRVVRLHWELGDYAAMDAATLELEALVERLPASKERGQSMATVAQSYMLRDRSAESIAWAQRAEADAVERGDEVVGVWARAERGSAIIGMPGRFEEGEVLLAEAADAAERLGEYLVVARALNNLVRADLRRPDPAIARPVLERMRAAAERAGFDSLAGPSYWQALADLAEWEGDLAGSMAALDEGNRRDHGYLRTAKGSWYRVHEAGLLLEVGDIDRADEVRAALAPSAGPKATWYHGLVVHIACRRGELATARAALTDLLEIAGRLGQIEAQLVSDLVGVAVPTGLTPADLRPLAALPLSAEHNTIADNDPRRRLVDGQLLEAEGQLDAALAAYRDVLVHGEMVLRPLAMGLGSVGGARCAIALGRMDEAKEFANAAEHALARWPGWRHDQLDAVRRRLGTGGGVEGPEALTRREREVAALLAEGLSNAELARRLYISPKTAAVHVSNILAKLGMASRTEVAAWAVREGLEV